MEHSILFCCQRIVQHLLHCLPQGKVIPQAKFDIRIMTSARLHSLHYKRAHVQTPVFSSSSWLPIGNNHPPVNIRTAWLPKYLHIDINGRQFLQRPCHTSRQKKQNHKFTPEWHKSSGDKMIMVTIFFLVSTLTTIWCIWIQHLKEVP